MRVLAADLSIDGFVVTPKRVLVKQADYAHEMVLATVPVQRLPHGGREDGLPVKLDWGWYPGNKRTFYGYVHHVEPYYDGDSATQYVRLVCLGATSALSYPIHASWPSLTVDAVARQLVEGVYLSFLGESSSQVWPALAATSGTAWEFLIRLASMVGFRLAGYGTEVRFQSLATLFDYYAAQAPRVTLGGELQQFRPDVGDIGGSMATARLVYGLDRRSGQLYTAAAAAPAPQKRLGTDLPRTTTAVSHVITDSPDDAAVKLAGAADTYRFAYHADAEIEQADPVYANGSIVFIDGVESSQNGHWYIEEAEHDLDPVATKYRVYLTLGRDALGSLQANPYSAVVRPLLRQTPAGDVQSGTPPTVQVDRVWRSGWARRAS